MGKKKLLIIANCSGGLLSFRKELIIELNKSYDIVLSTPIDVNIDEFEQLGCEIIPTQIERRGINPIKDLILINTYRKIIKKVDPDLVITYTIKPNIYGGVICRLNRVPYAANITGLGSAFENDNLLKKLVVYMYKIALKRVKVVFFENSDNRRVFINENIIPSKRACLLNGAGVNLDTFFLQPYPENEVFRFLFVGRVMKEKGVDELFSAMTRLRQNGYKCVLDILGGLEENYRSKIENYEKEGWLHYYGFQNDVKPFIKQCDCFVLPSYHEGMSNANLECASSGRPLITTNIPGCREAVINGKTGFLCEPKSKNSLFCAMQRMLNIDINDRKMMGVLGRKHMENKFEKRKVVDKTIKYLKR